MVISRTPFRLSFFGGGTDYPVYYLKNGGAVLSTTIDKYCYITSRYLPPFFNHKHNIVYSKIEKVTEFDEIQHPAFRETLKYMKVQRGLELHYDADLPARSGLGSSSSFVVSLLHSLHALNGKFISKKELADKAIHIEREIIGETVGSQDQYAAAYGGFNKISFNQDGSIVVNPIIITKEKKESLESHLLFFFTGFTRIASGIAREQVENTHKKETNLNRMSKMVDESIEILNCSGTEIKDFGLLLDESWQLKRDLTNKISNESIDEIYKIAKESGAYGGKLIGAGGGGFMVFIAHPDIHEKIKSNLKNLLHVPIKFDNTGSQIVFYNPEMI